MESTFGRPPYTRPEDVYSQQHHFQSSVAGEVLREASVGAILVVNSACAAGKRIFDVGKPPLRVTTPSVQSPNATGNTLTAIASRFSFVNSSSTSWVASIVAYAWVAGCTVPVVSGTFGHVSKEGIPRPWGAYLRCPLGIEALVLLVGELHERSPRPVARDNEDCQEAGDLAIPSTGNEHEGRVTNLQGRGK